MTPYIDQAFACCGQLGGAFIQPLRDFFLTFSERRHFLLCPIRADCESANR